MQLIKILSNQTMSMTKVLATPNIALVKYWGKRDEELILPMNNSISLTLDERLKCVASVEFSVSDEIVVNGKQGNAAAYKLLEHVRKKFGIARKFRIDSTTHFPVAGGLASSAAGFAAIAFGIGKLLLDEGIELGPKEISALARMGSGSACRSVLGGAVEWLKGHNDEDSYAVQLATPHKLDLVDVIGILSTVEKKVSSRMGMQQTVRTSGLFGQRLAMLDSRLEIVRRSLAAEDYETLFAETMKDSNNMHACMLDTWPPLVYMNQGSLEIIRRVHELNANGVIAAYTFDAGPNAHIITRKRDASKARALLDGIAMEIITSEIGNGPRLI